MATVGAMRAILSVNSTAFRGGMKGASTSLVAFSGVASTTTAAVYRLGGALTAVVGPFMGLYGAIRAMRVAEEFEQEMNSSLAIVDNVGEGMRKRMEKVAFDVAYATKFSMSQAADAYFELESAGMDLEQSMAALPQAAYFAQAGMMDLSGAIKAAASAQNALGLTVDDSEQNLANFTRVTSVLVKANKLAQASTEEFAAALANEAAASGTAAGQSLEEIVSVLAKFAQKAKVGEAAGTAYARAMNYLSIQAVENADAFAKVNVKMFDAADATRSLVDVIADLEVHFGTLTDKQRIVSMGQLGFTKKTIALMNDLLGGVSTMREFQAGLTGIGNVAKEVSDKQLPPLTAAWEKLKAVMTRWSIENLAPSMAELGEGISLLLDATKDLNEASENLEGLGGKDMSDRFRTVNMELEGMASWVGYIADLWDGMSVVLRALEGGIKMIVQGVVELADILTLSQFESLDEMATKLAESALDSFSKAGETYDDIGSRATKSQQMVLEQSKKNIEEYRKLRGKDIAAGGQAAGTIAPPVQYDPKPAFAKADAALDAAYAAANKLLAERAYATADAAFAKADAAHTAAYKTATDRAAVIPKAAGEGLAKAMEPSAGGMDIAGPLEAQMSKAKSIFNSTRTPLEKFNTQMEDLQSLLNVGAFAGQGGEETYRRAVEQARDAYAKASGANGADKAQPPALARMGSQDAYDLVRQNRMGGAGKEQPVVKELRENRRILGQIGDNMVDLVEISQEQTEALQGEGLNW